jgi:cytochrome c-type biogenesis protein CcmF
VHSFDTEPTRGLVILELLAVFIGGAFALFALRASALRLGGLFAPISREGALILNNLFLSTAMVAVLVGTLYPLLLEATTGKTISVGAPFFSLTFGALMAPLLIVLPFGPFLAWKRGDLVAVTQRLAWAAGLAVFAAVLIFALSGGQVSLAPLGLLLGFWVAFGAIAELVDRTGLGRMPLKTSWHRLAGLPRSAFSTALAHFGLGISVIGIVAASAWQLEAITTMQPGTTKAVGDYTLRFDGIDDVRVENYAAEVGKFTVISGGDERHLTPERRVYTASGTPTTEAAIETYGFSQLYVQLGEQSADGSRTVRVWYKPYVTLIWLGAILMALAGGLSLTDRRLRVGVARRAAAPKPAPAE